MTELFRAIVLGIVQGLTEFLPVSSSGHLELAKVILGDTALAEESMLMTVVLHFATALATIWVFRKDVWSIVSGIFTGQREDLDFALKIFISMLPAVAVGLLFEKELEALFDRQIMLVGFMLLLTGVLLFLADKAKQTDKGVGIKEAIIIGISQAIAILPGISRSGATISTSVLLGVDRSKAARFSFLMVVPLIFGKIAKDLLDGEIMAQASNWQPYTVGFLAAFFTGIFACTLMIQLVKRSQLRYFAYYCFVVAVLAIGYGFTQG
ncbi:MAG: undecaprenyl-diphosphate phosphatase [Saprospiraceae bacterium]